MSPKRSLYEPALDGLRLVAFAAVFLHHLPIPDAGRLLTRLGTHGWAGVELFFVISSFLLFRLLDAEHRRTGEVSFRHFYLRRVLRIYPLMIAFSAAMLIFASQRDLGALGRFLGIATFTDNIVAAVLGYNNDITFTGHLWTLGFEFQIYLLLPFAFLAWKRFGTARFLVGLGAFYALCVLARAMLTALGAPHPIVWVLPILQPDAILIGIVLATGVCERVPRAVWPALCLAALAGFLLTGPPWTSTFRAIVSYALIALASAALMQSVRTFKPLEALFSVRAVVYLGTISFGLYVFHLFGIVIGQRALALFTGDRTPAGLSQSLFVGVVGLAATIVLSMISYRWLELPFLRLKDRRFAVVHGRPMGPASPADAADPGGTAKPDVGSRAHG